MLQLKETRSMQEKVVEGNRSMMFDPNTMAAKSRSFWEITQAELVRFRMAWCDQYTGGVDCAHMGAGDMSFVHVR